MASKFSPFWGACEFLFIQCLQLISFMIIFGAQVIPNLISESPFKLVPLIWPLWALPCFLVQAVVIKRNRIESISASHIIRINIVWGNFCFQLEMCMFWFTVQTVFLSVGHGKKKNFESPGKKSLILPICSFLYLLKDLFSLPSFIEI